MDFNKIFHKVPVQVQNRSAFNCGHKNLFSADCGTLVPILCDPVIPNTTVKLGMACQVQLPPLATDFYGNIYAKMEVFFVPNRIIWGGWKDFITVPPYQERVSGSNLINGAKPYAPQTLPYVELTPNDTTSLANFKQVGGLADMLGFKSEFADPTIEEPLLVSNILPFLAYHKIYDDWYRDSRLQTPIFRPATNGTSNYWGSAPYTTSWSSTNTQIRPKSLSVGGIDLFTLHQRNWQKDYFTNATALPQAGQGASVQFNVSGGKGEFTIAALRSANALQMWFERNNIAGERYADQMKARFGIYPSDAVTDRAIYLGSKTFQVYNKTVYETVAQNTPQNSSNNFLGQLGAKASTAQGYGEDTLIQEFTATEHGHIIVIFSLVPEPLYSTGTRRYLTYSEVTDFPDPLLQGVGDQPIYSYELDSNPNALPSWLDPDVFGYTQRYSEAKFMNDEVHGLLRDGQSLSAFALQRSIETSGQGSVIGTQFLEIPKNYLDQVSNVNSEVSKFGCWSECYFNYTKIMPLAAYSIPTLGDPRDTHTEIIDNGGTRL